MPHPVERNAATAEEREQRLAEFGRAADKAALEDMRRRQDAQSGRPGEPLVGMTADGVPLDAETNTLYAKIQQAKRDEEAAGGSLLRKQGKATIDRVTDWFSGPDGRRRRLWLLLGGGAAALLATLALRAWARRHGGDDGFRLFYYTRSEATLKPVPVPQPPSPSGLYAPHPVSLV